MINWDNYDEELLSAVKIYVPNYESKDDSVMQELIDDVLSAMTKYQLKHYDEYFKFKFFGMPDDVRSTFCGALEYTKCVKNSINVDMNSISTFKDKNETYNIFKDYYKRDMIEVNGFEDFAKFTAFASKNKTFIVKELEGSLGSNISKVTITENTPVKAAFFKVLQYGGCVCEAWIEQSEEMKLFNSSSVNTVRVATMLDGDDFHKIYAMFRTGRNGEVVDNASMGGVACAVDMETGVIISDGYSKKLEHFDCHPDTKIQFKGHQIPRWDEVMPMLEKMHRLTPAFKLVGWDLALTDDGWVLIEGNSKPNIDTIQLIYGNTFGHGLKHRIMSALGKYNY